MLRNPATAPRLTGGPAVVAASYKCDTKKIASRLEEMGWSKSAFSSRIGVSDGAYYNWIRVPRQTMPAKRVVEIGRALALPIESFATPIVVQPTRVLSHCPHCNKAL
jgi:hypothetical protein